MTRPRLSAAVAAGCLLSFAALSGGCADYLRAPSAAGGGADRANELYGVSDVTAVVAAVKASGITEVMGSRAVRLPTRSLEPITSFNYRFPAACGGHAFRVFESGDTRILELQHELSDGSDIWIRDYLAGSSPFIRPGVWNAYDHTSDAIGAMTSRFVETTTPLFPAVYSEGLMTGLAESVQQELGAAYSSALRLAARCDDR